MPLHQLVSMTINLQHQLTSSVVVLTVYSEYGLLYRRDEVGRFIDDKRAVLAVATRFI